ncbi:protein MKS1-like [Diospyros lotus]|uniref:protein MKS1-like n=1 Tax=Diospyros lotus TaxID=55363 RepID=UPI00225822A0|nr:protein MKS1-like [Diospyros lotus]
MDPQAPDFSAGKSPRRELQGPRPTPLRVSKDSHKIRKPPIAPLPQHPSQPPPYQPRPPVIIYTVSPKVIHTDPSEFMTLVQRLTGSGSSGTSSSNPSSSSDFPDSSVGGAISPAARFASIEKTKSPEKKIKPQGGDMGVEIISTEVERSSLFPGILSPGPASLPPIPASFFSPPADPNPLGFFHDLSPVFQGNKNYLETSFMPSPSYFLSPNTPSLDIFNNFFDI